jgi:tetratricopeptide (TPR) repeat protein
MGFGTWRLGAVTLKKDTTTSGVGRSRAANGSGAGDPTPGTYDEVSSDDLPVELEADFAPLPEAGTDRPPVKETVDPFQYDSLQAQEAFDAAVAAAAAGDEQEAIQQYIRAAKTAETAHEWHLAAVACQRLGDFLAGTRPPYDLERAFRMYRRAVAAYDQCGLFAEARSVAYRQLCLKMRRARELKLSIGQRVELFLYWAVAGFGYRPLRVIGTALAIVFVFGLIYWAMDGVQKSDFQGHISLWKAIYFSGITFATVGYGDFVPAPHVRWLAMSEGFVGAFTMGLFVAVLANRLSNT